MKNYKGLSGLGSCKCCCFENLLTAKWSTGVTRGTGVGNSWLFFIVFVSISYFKLVFLQKAIMGCILLNVSLKLLLALNMYQCLFIISFIFSSTGLYVTENEIECLRLDLHCFKNNDLSRWSNLSICFLAVDLL